LGWVKDTVRVIVKIDEELFLQARSATQITRVEDLIEAGLTALVQREASSQLARLGGSQPDLEDIPRRHSALPNEEPDNEP
jgi:hypothetical protein